MEQGLTQHDRESNILDRSIAASGMQQPNVRPLQTAVNDVLILVSAMPTKSPAIWTGLLIC
jgi:hypothetical protein